ncbi:nuclear body protein SP140-like protein isoform X2 [Colossoma macropomum]|uniref:nuclear body protein SP140-like protein isoform X2 n=1 Tax=Colossoma macropomum TaxID=42526 RepID=UPI001864E4AC|nr:nuclear body protein SP140-like protein isoform X2 [Colossoma macropomum]
MMAEVTETEMMTETETDSDCLSEEEQMKTRKQRGKRKMMTETETDSDWLSEEEKMKTKRRRKRKMMTETETDSDWLSEEEHMNMRNQGRKRRMMTRSCRKNGQLRLSPVHNSNQEMPTQSPASIISGPSVNKRLEEHIRNKQALSVCCEKKGGILYKEKFNNSEPCILSEGQWFTPSEFEKYGGKEKNRKWRTSILYRQFPLQTLIEGGFLSSPSFKQKKIQDKESSPVGRGSLGQPRCRRALFTSSGSTRHVTNDHTTEIISQSSSDDSISYEEDPAHVTQFQGKSFPVTCSTGRGVLYKSRFATGKCDKCIRTEYSWLSPEEFVNLNMNNGNWRRDITSHGKSLRTLIMSKVLEFHGVTCACSTCSKENLDQDNDDECFFCNSGGDLVCCDECPRAFHHDCHSLPAQDDTLGDPWICSFCTAARD